MPTTHWTFLFGCLALAGVVPFAGFWSKDAILAAVTRARAARTPVPGAVHGGVVTALLTAFYAFRAYFLTFFGPERIPAEAGHHAHESPRTMTLPLVILAFCALVVGAYFEFTHGFAEFLVRTPSLAYRGLARRRITGTSRMHWRCGHEHLSWPWRASAWRPCFIWATRRPVSGWPGCESSGSTELSRDKFFFDPIYNAGRRLAAASGGQLAAWFDRCVIDGLVDLVRHGSARRWRSVSGRCKAAWSSSTPWRWCWGCWC